MESQLMMTGAADKPRDGADSPSGFEACRVPMRFMALGVAASFAAIVVTAGWLWQSQQALTAARKSHNEFQSVAVSVTGSGDLLAATLRLYLYSTTDAESRWKSRWEAVERREERRLEQVERYAREAPRLAAKLAEFKTAHKALERRHERVFERVRHGGWVVAVRSLDSADHEAATGAYEVALKGLVAAENELQDRRVAAAERRFESAALILAVTLALLGGAWIVVLVFAARQQRHRIDAEKSLRTVLAEREREIEKRTAELHARNAELRLEAQARERAVEALRRRGATLIEEMHINNVVLENMDQGVLFVDAGLNVVLCNQRVFEIQGLPENCIKPGTPYAEYAKWVVDHAGLMAEGVPLDLDEVVARAQRRCAMPSRFELSRADGAVIEISSRPLMDGGFVAVISDYTELRRAERQLREVIDKVPCGIVMADMGGAIRLVNGEIERIFGYDQGELSGVVVETLLPDVDQGREVIGHRKDGGVFPADVSLSVVDTPDGPMWLAAVLDVTERHKLQAQLLGSQKLQSIGQLAAGIAHEINTPVQYVGDNIHFLEDSFAEILKLHAVYADLLAAARSNTVTPDLLVAVDRALEQADWAFIEAEVPAAITQSEEGVQRVAAIVRAMKEFSHPGSSKKESVDLNHLIETTATVARNEWKYVATLDFELDSTLPPVTCRPGEIGEVLLNLVVNAAHAIGDLRRATDGAPGRITLGTTHDAEFAEIRVTDTGSGIPAAARTRVFDPFFTTKEVGKGTGQGLAIARSVVVDKHGGSIDFETRDGEGTTFIVRLPLAATESEPRDEAA